MLHYVEKSVVTSRMKEIRTDQSTTYILELMIKHNGFQWEKDVGSAIDCGGTSRPGRSARRPQHFMNLWWQEKFKILFYYFFYQNSRIPMMQLKCWWKVR